MDGDLDDDETNPEHEDLLTHQLIKPDSTISSTIEVASNNSQLQSDCNEMPGVVIIAQETGNQDGADGLSSTQIEQLVIEILDNSLSSEESDVNQAWFTSREDKSNLHNKGHVWKQGMWSKDETDMLQCNIDKYCKDRNIHDATEIIFEMTKDERKDFYRTIAKGLNRPLFSVYRRVIRMYDNKNHVGKYTPEEIEKLKALRVKHGNDWQAIGNALGRSASSIKDRCRLMKDNCNTGKWLPSEERRLAEAVYDLSRARPGEMVTSGISWSSVAERVGTRSEKQCRTKWLNYLNWKQVGGTEWTREDDINLICKIYNMHLDDENSIDWTELANGWPSVRSPQWLRGKWWNLKRHVPSCHLLTFSATCEYLYKNHAQNVRMKSSTPPETTSVSVGTSPAISIPRVSVVQIPNIVTAVPVHLETQVASVQPSTLVKDGNASAALGSFQAFEVIPPSVQLTPTGNPAMFLITPTQAAIPFSTCTPNSAGQIIIQADPGEAIHNSENVTVQMTMPSQIIISTGGNPATTLASLGAANLGTPIHIGPLRNDALSAVGALTATAASELMSSDLDPTKLQNSVVHLTRQEDLMQQVLESEEENSTIGEEEAVSSISESAQAGPGELESAHLILSDPMLSSNSADLMVSVTEADCDKNVNNEDSLEHSDT